MFHYPPTTTYFDLVALASSAGGLNALSIVLDGLPISFPAAVLIVQHMRPNRETLLPLLLSHQTSLLIKLAEEHDAIRSGVVFIAPPNFHLLVNPDRTLSLSEAAPENFSRPSADVLFRSIASSFSDRAIAVVLSGTGKDGSAGVRVVHNRGGKVIAQDRSSASYFSMPHSAILTGCVDYILPLKDIPKALVQLTQTGTLV